MCLKYQTIEAIPYFVACFPTLAFPSGVNCTCGPHPFEVSFNPSLVSTIASEITFFATSFATTILKEGTSVVKRPLELSKTNFFLMKL